MDIRSSGFRYSDFHVHELSLDGSTARLTSFTLPQDPKKVGLLQFFFSHGIFILHCLSLYHYKVTTKLDSVFSTDDVERLRVLSQNGNSDEEIKIKVRYLGITSTLVTLTCH